MTKATTKKATTKKVPKDIKVVYEGKANAIVDPKAMEKRDKKRAEARPPLPPSRKTEYKAGTILMGVEFPTNKEVTVTDPALIAMLKKHVKNEETADTEGSPFRIV